MWTLFWYAPFQPEGPRSLPQTWEPLYALPGSPARPFGGPCCQSSWAFEVSPKVPWVQPLSPAVSKSSVKKTLSTPMKKSRVSAGARRGKVTEFEFESKALT